MGLETKTAAKQGRKKFDGKLYLDSKFLTFKSKELKWSAELGKATKASYKNDTLVVVCGKEKLTFAVGKSAPRWAEKINNPPKRVTKLGIKPTHKFWLSKGFTKAFADELKATGAAATRKIESCDIAFWIVTHRKQLDEFENLTSQLGEGVNIWIIWTKGSEAINQTEVMKTAKSHEFGPSKTAAFDDEHSSMRFAKRKSK